MPTEIFRIDIEVKYQKGGNGLWDNWICVGNMNGGDSACSGNRYILIYPPDKQNSEFDTSRYSEKASIRQKNYHFYEGPDKLDNDGTNDLKFSWLVNLEGNWTATLFSNQNNSEYPGHKPSKYSLRKKNFTFYVKIISDSSVEILDTQVLFLFIKLYGNMVDKATHPTATGFESDYSIKTGSGNFFTRSKGYKTSSYYIQKGRSYGNSNIITSPMKFHGYDENKQILSTVDGKGNLLHTDECTDGLRIRGDWTRFQHSLSDYQLRYRQMYGRSRPKALPGGNKRIRYKTKKNKRNKQVKRVKRTKKYRTNKNKYITKKNKYRTK